MSNIQNRFNQLAQSASYYASINPGLREKQAEASALRTSVKRAEGAKSAADRLGEGLVDRFLSDPGAEGKATREQYSKDIAQFKSDTSVMSHAYRGVENAYGSVYEKNPTDKTLQDYLGAQKARTAFEADISSFIETTKEFEQFWKDLEDAGFTGLTQVEADALYRNSTKVGGSR